MVRVDAFQRQNVVVVPEEHPGRHFAVMVCRAGQWGGLVGFLLGVPVELGVETGLFIANGTAEVTFKVTMSWGQEQGRAEQP